MVKGYVRGGGGRLTSHELSFSWAVGKHGGSGQITGCSLEMLLVDGGL